MSRNRDFQRLYRSGKSAVGGCVVAYCRPNRLGRTRLGLTVSTKLGGAVRRNRIRRRIKECYRVMEAGLKPGFDLVLVARSRAFGVPFKQLERELTGLLDRLQMTV
jgi:ribonuclease P protein component